MYPDSDPVLILIGAFILIYPILSLLAVAVASSVLMSMLMSHRRPHPLVNVQIQSYAWPFEASFSTAPTVSRLTVTILAGHPDPIFSNPLPSSQLLVYGSV